MAGFLAGELWIRLGMGAVVFAVMAGWEAVAPRRAQAIGRWIRWPNNLGILIVDTIILRLLFPAAAVGAAIGGEERGWGLLNNLPMPPWIPVIAAVIVLDLVIYFQHVLFHAVPALWRLHRMHHADLEFDVTTGVRFHPVEILLLMVIKLGVVLALGAPALAVLIFEMLLNATSMFNHGNVLLPQPIDRVLRMIVVTPEMQRIHHSIEPAETNSKFRLQSVLVGLALRHLSRSAGGRSCPHDDRHRPLPASRGSQIGSDADPAARRRGGTVSDPPTRLMAVYAIDPGIVKRRSHGTKANAPRGICASLAEVARLDQMRRHGNAFQSTRARLRRLRSTRTWRKIPAIYRATN